MLCCLFFKVRCSVFIKQSFPFLLSKSIRAGLLLFTNHLTISVVLEDKCSFGLMSQSK